MEKKLKKKERKNASLVHNVSRTPDTTIDATDFINTWNIIRRVKGSFC